MTSARQGCELNLTEQGGRVRLLFGSHLTTTGRHVAPVGQTQGH